MKIPATTKVIIFDMDGVLFLSGSAHEKAYKSVLGDIGINGFDYSRFAGMRTDDCLRIVLDENQAYISDDRISRLVERKRFLANKLLKDNVPVLSDCRHIVSSLSNNYKLMLASSASRENIELFFKYSYCKKYFQCIIDGSMVEKAKPSPEIYRLCLSNSEVLPEECLVIEDSSNGVLAAKAAGMVVYGVLGTTKSTDLKKSGADAVIINLKDIL